MTTELTLASFGELVAEAAAHLYDLPYLQTHRLGQILVPEPGPELRCRALQRILQTAIDALKPADESEHAAGWRTYHYLVLRYVQGVSSADVASDLGISGRQTRRTSRAALDALSSVLWDRHLERHAKSHPDATLTWVAMGPERTLPSTKEFATREAIPSALLDHEVGRLTEGGNGAASDLAEVLSGLGVIIGTFGESQRCAWQANLAPDLPAMAADRSVVRLLLLSLATLGFERGPGRLDLSASTDSRGILVTLRHEPNVSRSKTLPIDNGPNQARLDVCHRIVQSEGGTLTVEVDVKGRLTLSVTLPEAVRPTVLVVDDNPEVVTLFERYLESAGLAVLTAVNGAAGFRLARDAHPDAITLDVMMANQDGWETLQLLKNHPETREIPVIVCSVLREETLARFLRAAELLAKPVTRPELLAALERCGVHAPLGAYPGSS